MSLSKATMKKTRIRYTDCLGTANVVRGAVIASLGLLSNDVRFAGGAARDLRDEVEPKDYDLIIPRCAFNRPGYDGVMCSAEAFDNMSGLMKDLQLALGDGAQVEIYQAYDQSSGDFDERLLCAGTVKWHGVQVDVLMSTSDTLLDALEGFDSDINQAYIKGGYVVSVDVGSYKMLKPQRSECRYQKLLAVAQRRGTHLERFKE